MSRANTIIINFKSHLSRFSAITNAKFGAVIFLTLCTFHPKNSKKLMMKSITQQLYVGRHKHLHTCIGVLRASNVVIVKFCGDEWVTALQLQS